jgi:hypothetical protein
LAFALPFSRKTSKEKELGDMHLIVLIFVSLFSAIALATDPMFATNLERQSLSVCQKVLSLDPGLLKGVSRKPKNVKEVFRRLIPEQNREFLVIQVNLSGFVPRPIQLNKLKLRYVLVATDENRVVWQFEEYVRHVPTAFVLSPTDRNVGFIGKKVESFYPAEDAPETASARRDLPGELASETLSEILKVSLTNDGGVKLEDLYTSKHHIYSLEMGRPTQLIINGTETIDLP